MLETKFVEIFQNPETEDQYQDKDELFEKEKEEEVALIQSHLHGFFDTTINHWKHLTEKAVDPSEANSFARQYALVLMFNLDTIIECFRNNCSDRGFLEFEFHDELRYNFSESIQNFFKFYTTEIKRVIYESSFRSIDKGLRYIPRKEYEDRQLAFAMLTNQKLSKNDFQVELSRELILLIWALV